MFRHGRTDRRLSSLGELLHPVGPLQGPRGEINIDEVQSIPVDKDTVGKTIVDRPVATGRNWKTYQESVPPGSVSQVNYSDGLFRHQRRKWHGIHCHGIPPWRDAKHYIAGRPLELEKVSSFSANE
jgi:hypothetical protein